MTTHWGESPRLPHVAHRVRPWFAASASYVVGAVLVLSPALSPGRTVVPADIVNQFAPFAEVVRHHQIHNSLPSDAGLQYYPWLDLLGESLRNGHLPEWNPALLGGVPFTPNGYVTDYYPPYLLAGAVDPREAYTIFVLIDLLVAAIGTYAFGRVLGLSPRAAWLGGLCSFAALHWIHWSLHLNHATGMVWLPGVLAASERAISRPRRSSAAALALVFGLWWLGGGVQYTYFGTLAVGGYVLLSLVRCARRDAWRALHSFATLAGGLVLGTALAAPLLIPMAQISAGILRIREPVSSMSATHYPLVDTLLLLVPDARGNPVSGVLYRAYSYGWGLDTPFFGVTALLLTCAGIASRPRRWIPLVVGVAAALLLGFTGWPHVVLHAFVPGYDRFRVSSRWFSVLPAFSLALAAAGVEALLADSRRAHRAIYAAAAVAAAAILAYGGFVLADPSSPKRFFAEALAASLVPVGALVAAARLVPGRREVAFALISSAVVFEILLHTVTWYPSVRKSEAYPPLSFAQAIRARGGRMVRVAPAYTQLGPFPPDLPMPYHLADAEGQAVLFPSRYDRFLRLVDNYGMYALATNTAPPLTRPQMLTSPLMRALDVRTAVVDPSVRMPRRFHRVASVGIDAYAVRSLGPAILVPHARPTTTANMWRSIADPKWNPASFAAVVGLPRAVDGEPGKVTLLRKSFDRENWHVVAPRGGLLRISGNYNPGWSARIDGRPTRIFLADGIFRSVVVPEGTHNVQFAYRNQAEGLGRKLAMAALGAIVLLLLPLRSTFRPRRKEVVQA